MVKKVSVHKDAMRVTTIKQAAISAAVSQVMGVSPHHLKIEHTGNMPDNSSWDKLNALSNEIAIGIMTMAEQVNESVNLVRTHGCDHPEEFNTVVLKSNQDFEKFLKDFESVKARHSHRTGSVETIDDRALMLSVYESYIQFRAFFEGVMHHTLISFTEYALEAKARLQDKLKAEEAEEAAKANQEQPISTEGSEDVKQ